MMEWKEILDQFERDTNHGYHDLEKDIDGLSFAVQHMLQKLASEEAKKPEQPVKDGFRLTRINHNGEISYEFTDAWGDKCTISHPSNTKHLALGASGEISIHLSESMVKALLPLLQEFVDKGEIS